MSKEYSDMTLRQLMVEIGKAFETTESQQVWEEFTERLYMLEGAVVSLEKEFYSGDRQVK